ncbi:MAG: hypothetical protein H7Z14_02260 [Anaerolineae bacterium]|nr:hypothetical protein [Phycisphaerae bacterium]
MKFTFCLVVVLLAVPALGVVTVSPIGDSLTSGVGSSEMGGYREHVKDVFGDRIDFLGRRADGAFDDNQDEGWGGFTINTIRTNTITTIPKHSGFGQVVLLTAGTNEFAWVTDVANDNFQLRANQALADMESLLNETFNIAGDVTVLVSNIPAIRDWYHPTGYLFPGVDIYNAGLPDVIARVAAHNHDVRFVDTASGLNLQTDFWDGIHPNDSGYAKIGAAWSNALNSVVPEPTSAIALAPLLLLARRRR